MPCPQRGDEWKVIGPDGGVCPSHGYIPRAELDAARPDKESVRPASIPRIEGKRESLAAQLVSLVEESSVQLFHDQFQEPHAAFHGDGRLVAKLKSKVFRRWLSRLAWEHLRKAAGGEAMQGALSVLEARAIFDGPCIPLHVRVAWHEEAIWYDLGDGRAVRVKPGGWELIAMPPILFRRFSHQKAQVEPHQSGRLDTLFKFLNVKGDVPRLLFICDIVASLVPEIPHPVTVIHGSQGSAKTWLSKAKKELLDPSVVRTFTAPDNLREFVQLASHHYFLPLDNLTSIPDWLSDCLCRLVTGDGFSKRELYSDDEDVLYAFSRAAAVNGINLVVRKPDLLERSLIFGLERIPKSERKEDTELWAAFEAAKPEILGGMFDLLAGAMRELPNVRPAELPRMADFARWGCAIAVARGLDSRDFLEAYGENVGRQTEEAIAASSVAQTVVALMESRDEWRGTPSQLLNTLEEVGVQAGLLKRSAAGNVTTKGWPGAAHILARRLNEVRSNLADIGIEITESRSDGRQFEIQREAIQQRESSVGSDSSVVADAEEVDSPVATDATVATSPTSRPDGWEVKIE